MLMEKIKKFWSECDENILVIETSMFKTDQKEIREVNGKYAKHFWKIFRLRRKILEQYKEQRRVRQLTILELKFSQFFKQIKKIRVSSVEKV